MITEMRTKDTDAPSEKLKKQIGNPKCRWRWTDRQMD